MDYFVVTAFSQNNVISDTKLNAIIKHSSVDHTIISRSLVRERSFNNTHFRQNSVGENDPLDVRVVIARLVVNL